MAVTGQSLRAGRGEVAVVTGAAQGIGAAIAMRLARDGYDVALLDLNDRAERVASDIRAGGRRSLFVSTDVSDPRQVDAAHCVVRDSLGVARVLVNNAAIYPRSTMAELDWELWCRVLAVNLGGAFLCSKLFGGAMVNGAGGVIVNIGSGASTLGVSRGAHYAAAKGGLVSLTRSLALEWAPRVRVNLVLPGQIDTEQPLGSGRTRQEIIATAKAKVPMRRIGAPADVAGVVAFLVGPDAGYLTGASVSANGGVVME